MRKLLCLSALLSYSILINMTAFGQATVSGRVAIGSQPAAGVEVMLSSSDPVVLNSNPPPPISAQTDADGRYKLMNVSAGSYRILAYAPAYVAKTEGNQSWIGRTLSVSEGENIENIDFTLTRGAVITGRVTDSSGRGVIEESVTVVPVDAEGKRINNPAARGSSARTDDRGVYRVFGLSAGRYRVGAGPAPGDGRAGFLGGGRYLRTWHPDATEESAARIVAVEPGDEVEKIDIILVPAEKRDLYSVSGKVIDAGTGAAVAGAMILHTSLKGGQPQGPAMNSTASNSRGEFRIDTIPSGLYEVSAVMLEGGDSYSELVGFEIGSGDVSGIEIRMHRGASISGSVVVEGGAPPEVMAGLSKIDVFARPVPPGQIRFFGGRGRVAADGSFRIGGLPPGKMSLIYSNFTAPKGLSFLRVEHNGAAGREIDLQPGENVTGVRLVLLYGAGVIAGRVEVRNGTLPPGSRLSIIATRVGVDVPTVYNAEVDNRGQFVLEGFAPGTYLVRLLARVPTADQQWKTYSVRREVPVTGSGRQEITLVLDLSQPGQE